MKKDNKAIATVIHAISHPTRIEIMEILNKETEVSVKEICNKLSLEQSLTSHHLMLLTKAGFLKHRRNGKYIFYSINSPMLFSILQIVKDHFDLMNK